MIFQCKFILVLSTRSKRVKREGQREIGEMGEIYRDKTLTELQALYNAIP
jgi:hypothetical protein